MSAIEQYIENNQGAGPDGVRRYRTTCKVLIHDFTTATNGALDISQDVVHITTNKQIKGVGTATVIFTSAKNYLNLIFPNNYINIYWDINDGTGFTRQFFGFVDRINEKYVVGPDGKPSTTYTVTCSDFSKVFEKTFLYVNAQLAQRKDLASQDIGKVNIGGLAIASKGVEVEGSPADIIQNLIALLLGFGTQFELPPGYNPAFYEGNKKKLIESFYNTRRNIVDVESFIKLLEDQLASAKAEALKQAGDKKSSLADVGAATASLFEKGLNKLGINADNKSVFSTGIITTTVMNTLSRPASFMDILDLYSYVESDFIDGYHGSTGIWAKDGPISSVLNEYCNDMVNELMFDLRPVSDNDSEEYSRKEDEVKGNLAEGGIPAGIKYAPAVILREYPYSTIHKYDGDSVELSLRDSADNKITLGEIPIHAVFSDQIGKPGRHLIPCTKTSYASTVFGKESSDQSSRILDVAVVYEHEIKSTDFGRSDHDHFNLFEVIDDFGFTGEGAKFFMQDLLPIVSPVHIARNGIRVRSERTKFCRPSMGSSTHTNPTSLVNVVVESDKLDTEDPVPSVHLSGGIAPPLTHGGTSKAPSKWGWRYNGAEGIWKFHNGIDLYAPKGTPVYAIADGYVVMAAPLSSLGFYSQSVMIQHPQLGGGDLYSFYAHLDDIEAPFKTNLPGNAPRAAYTNEDVVSGGQYAKKEVKKGQLIGKSGNNGGPGNGIGGPFSVAPHLHFELIRKIEGKSYPSQYGLANAAKVADINRLPEQDLAYVGVSAKPHSNLNGTGGLLIQVVDPGNKLASLKAAGQFPFESKSQRSMDPFDYFQENGINLADAARGLSGAGGGESTTDEDDGVTPDDPTDNVPPAPGLPSLPANPLADKEEKATTKIDNGPIRIQIARWAILLDHWYQHNTEYLSGSIDMRGAPEIRPGYRLDLPERELSFYIEAVTQSWDVNKDLITNLQVTRGQTNNPFPLFVAPTPIGKQKMDGNSRLGSYFVVPDPVAVRRSLSFTSHEGFSGVNLPMNDLENPGKYKPEVAIPADTTRLAPAGSADPFSKFKKAGTSLIDTVGGVVGVDPSSGVGLG